MKPLDLALRYMEIIYSEEGPQALKEILAEDVRFEGPFFEFDTADDYIAAMEKYPPKDFQYDLVHSYEDQNSACLIYHFTKPGVKTPMMQFFEVDNQRITRILLIFDSAPFTGSIKSLKDD